MIVRFEQDPEEIFGTGVFYDEKGRATYISDPQTAVRFTSTMKGSEIPGTVPKPDLSNRMFAGPGVPQDSSSVSSPQTAPNTPTPDQTPRNTTPLASQAKSDTVRDTLGKLDELHSIQQSTETQLGRPRANVEADIGRERQANEAYKQNLSQVAEEEDYRNTQAIRSQIKGTLRLQDESQRNLDRIVNRSELNQDEINRLQAEKDATLDPNRVIDNMSTGKFVLSAILAGIFGGLSAVGNQRNGFVDAWNRGLDQDIESQKLEIANNKATRQNRIAELVRRGISLENAEMQYRKEITDASRALIDLHAKDFASDGAAQTRAKEMMGGLDKDFAQRENQYRAQAENRTAVRTGSTIEEKPSKGMSQKDIYETLTAEQKYRNENKDINDADRVSDIIYGSQIVTDENGNPVAKKLNRQLSPDRVKEIRGKVSEVGKELDELTGLEGRLKALADATGSTYNPRTGEFNFPEDIRGVGPIDRTTGMVPGVYTESDKVKAQQKMLQQYLTQNLTGANSSLKQDEAFQDAVGGSGWKESKFKDAIDVLARITSAQRAVHEARMGTDGKKLYDYERKINTASGPKVQDPKSLSGFKPKVEDL